jgi:hypothetical protein
MSDDDWGNDGDDGGWGDDAGGDDDGWGNAEVDGDGGWGANDDVDMDTGGGGEMTLEDQIANAFYEGEDERRDDPASAVGKFKQVIALGEEAQKGDSQPSLDTISAIFNSMGHLAMAYLQLHNIEEMVKYLDMMVAFSVNVSRNDATATVDRVLGAVDTDGDGDFKLVKQVYTSIIDGLQKLQDYEQIIFKYRLKLVNTLVARLAFPEAEEELDALHQTLKRADGSDKSEPSEKCSAQLIEVYVLRYVLAKAQGKQIDGKALFDSTYRLQGAINNPKSMSVIRQVWGQMFGDQGHWNKAYLEFFSAFRDLVELGDSANAKRCLQCVVVSNMLSKEGQVNPFDAREAKIYQTDKDLVPFSTLRTAFEKSDVTLFAGALEDIRVCADEWVITHLGSMVTGAPRHVCVCVCAGMHIFVYVKKTPPLYFLPRQTSVNAPSSSRASATGACI